MREVAQTIFLAIGAGFALAVAWLAVVLLASVWARAMCWIDDESDTKKRPNPVIARIARLHGYTWQDYWASTPCMNGEAWMRWCKPGKDAAKPDTQDGEIFVAKSLAVVFALPVVVTVSVLFYPIAIAAALLVLIAHLARFAKRHKKLFDHHLKDPKAHKD